ncbi:MAG: sodium-translocating pyrophosphatase [Candidatus Micrarchaeota archaeon]|nr:sodium-translocating pyrophosphatase [Candidatus Micrarchaeota archaeon]
MDASLLFVLAAPAAGLIGFLYVYLKSRQILAQSEGTPKMREISGAIRQGAQAYLNRQFMTISKVVAVLALIITWALGLELALTFLFGAICSFASGYIGMQIAIRSNVRTAAAAEKGVGRALDVAFGAGTTNGMLISSVGLFGIGIITMVMYLTMAGSPQAELIAKLSVVIVGFSFGASTLALFMRVGGGIFTKAADVGADLVGKVEAGIPEDDPRNPATIADNVGDNVGDCAGMGADLFESYAAAFVSSMILGAIAVAAEGRSGFIGLVFPLLVGSAGLLSSLVGTFFTKVSREDQKDLLAPLTKSFFVANVLSVILFAFLSLYFFGDLKAWVVLSLGLVVSDAISRITEHYTSVEKNPVKKLAQTATTGAGTCIIEGTALGMESAFMEVLLVAVAIYVGYGVLGYFGIALVGLGMLATTGIIVSMDTFGPISDNAQGIAEMSGMPSKQRSVLDRLDAVGNTTKALTKGVAISGAAITAVALFSTYLSKISPPNTVLAIDVAQPTVFIGLLLSAAVPFLFCSMTIRAVGRAAFLIVEEVRHQFKTKKILQGKDKPDYAHAVDICTKAALGELVLPVLLALIAPVAVGFILGPVALAGFLGGAIVSAQMLAVYLCNSGGAWDNAKKYIERGNFGGKGTPTHAAAVVGDTVGDPFKDTAGPALNILMKVMSVMAVLIAGLLVGKSMGV